MFLDKVKEPPETHVTMPVKSHHDILSGDLPTDTARGPAVFNDDEFVKRSSPSADQWRPVRRKRRYKRLVAKIVGRFYKDRKSCFT